MSASGPQPRPDQRSSPEDRPERGSLAALFLWSFLPLLALAARHWCICLFPVFLCVRPDRGMCWAVCICVTVFKFLWPTLPVARCLRLRLTSSLHAPAHPVPEQPFFSHRITIIILFNYLPLCERTFRATAAGSRCALSRRRLWCQRFHHRNSSSPVFLVICYWPRAKCTLPLQRSESLGSERNRTIRNWNVVGRQRDRETNPDGRRGISGRLWPA